jgi:hypothetical protein
VFLIYFVLISWVQSRRHIANFDIYTVAFSTNSFTCLFWYSPNRCFWPLVLRFSGFPTFSDAIYHHHLCSLFISYFHLSLCIHLSAHPFITTCQLFILQCSDSVSPFFNVHFYFTILTSKLLISEPHDITDRFTYPYPLHHTSFHFLIHHTSFHSLKDILIMKLQIFVRVSDDHVPTTVRNNLLKL